MIRRIPLIPLQAAIYNVLKPPIYIDGVPVYDNVPKKATLPYITLGAFTCRTNGAKRVDIADVSIQVQIWSTYSGKKQVNEIANDVMTILTSVPLDLSADNFKVMEQGCDMFESFPEETYGYHGVITFTVKIQNLGG